MAKAEVTFVRINASSSYTLVRSSASYSDATATEVVLDYDTLNRYFRDESFGITDAPALLAGKNFADNVGTFTDAIETVGVGKGFTDSMVFGDFAYVLLTLQRDFTDSVSFAESITILNRSLAPSLMNTGAFNTSTLNN
jgi:hypothetical protein|tara:strand:- start:392 stop:808 length:417 start_codon:yes stop_codon:yes gene_type:complete